MNNLNIEEVIKCVKEYNIGNKENITYRSIELFQKELNNVLAKPFYEDEMRRRSLLSHLKKPPQPKRDHVIDLIEKLAENGIDLERYKKNSADRSTTVYKSEKKDYKFIMPGGRFSGRRDEVWSRINIEHLDQTENYCIVWVIGSWDTCFVIPPEIFASFREDENYILLDRNGNEKGYELKYNFKTKILRLLHREKNKDLNLQLHEYVNRWDRISNFSGFNNFGLQLKDFIEITSDVYLLASILEFQKTSIENIIDDDDEKITNEELNENLEIKDIVEEIENRINKIGFQIDDSLLIKKFISCMSSSKIIVLSGPPGAGKSSFPNMLSKILNGKTFYVPVQPQWTDTADLIGYPNQLKNENWVHTNFSKSIEYAINHQDELCFIVLDEMNLGKVEYYFSRFIQQLEHPSKLATNVHQNDPVKKWPENAWIIGTTNIDETSQSLSPRFLDRTFTIKFPLPLLKQSSFNEITNITEEKSKFLLDFLIASKEMKIDGWEEQINNFNDLNSDLKMVNAHISPRSLKHIENFTKVMLEMVEKPVNEIVDYVLLLKIHVKIKILRDGLSEIFESLKNKMNKYRYSKSAYEMNELTNKYQKYGYVDGMEY